MYFYELAIGQPFSHRRATYTRIGLNHALDSNAELIWFFDMDCINPIR